MCLAHAVYLCLLHAGLLDVQAWFKDLYTPTLINDAALSDCNNGNDNAPSCCVLQYHLFGDQDVCDVEYDCNYRRTSKENKQAGAGTPAAGGNQSTAGGDNNKNSRNQRRKRFQPADSLANGSNVVADGSKKAAAMAATTTNSNGDSYYYKGDATVAVGTFIIQHARHSHKWESKGESCLIEELSSIWAVVCICRQCWQCLARVQV